MNWMRFCRQRAERFAQLLDEANGGRRHHVRSKVDPDLARPVAIGQRLRAVQSSVEVDPDFRAGLRAMLVATAERDGIGATAGAEPGPESAADQSRPSRSPRGAVRPAASRQRRRVRARGAIVVGVAIGAIAVSGMSAASENAVPGDALYGVKRSTERAQLALASSDLSRGQLFLDFARTRLAEAVAVRRDSIGFAAVLNDMDADTRQGIKLLTTSAVQRKNDAALDLIDAFLADQRQQVAGMLNDGPRTQHDRAAKSLALLDDVKRRSDGLRLSLTCDAGATGRTDGLGPMPRGCPASRNSTGRPADAPAAEGTGDRILPDPPRTDRIVPPAPAHKPRASEQPAVEAKPSASVELTGPAAGRVGG